MDSDLHTDDEVGVDEVLRRHALGAHHGADMSRATTKVFRAPPLVQANMEKYVCGTPGCDCDASVLGAACHPKSGMDIQYDSERGVLRIYCHICSKHVVNVAVAERAVGQP
jgi:hypothetical protein